MRAHNRAGSGWSTATGPCLASRCSSRCAWPDRHSGPAQSLTSRVTRRPVGSLSCSAERSAADLRVEPAADRGRRRRAWRADSGPAPRGRRRAVRRPGPARAASAPIRTSTRRRPSGAAWRRRRASTGRKTGSSSPAARALRSAVADSSSDLAQRPGGAVVALQRPQCRLEFEQPGQRGCLGHGDGERGGAGARYGPAGRAGARVER